MLKIINKIRVKIKEIQYKCYIEEHRTNVMKAFIEMTDCEELNYIFMDEYIYWSLMSRIENHDMSKYSKEEFDAYRKNFFPINQKENNKEAFEKAWEHHWKTNDHHWQNRQDNKGLGLNSYIAVLENVCDWLAMGYKFNDRPYQYYEKHKNEIKLNEEDRAFLEHIIYEGIDKKYILAEQGAF